MLIEVCVTSSLHMVGSALDAGWEEGEAAMTCDWTITPVDTMRSTVEPQWGHIYGNLEPGDWRPSKIDSLDILILMNLNILFPTPPTYPIFLRSIQPAKIQMWQCEGER